jgi:predicted metal-dependent HD superfamily phosphohydrolase
MEFINEFIKETMRMKINNAIVAQAAEYVSDYSSKHLSEDFCYHDFFHTFSVVNAVDRLCAVTAVSKQEKRILLTAAWFHDAGYTQQTDEHERTWSFNCGRIS